MPRYADAKKVVPKKKCFFALNIDIPISIPKSYVLSFARIGEIKQLYKLF